MSLFLLFSIPLFFLIASLYCLKSEKRFKIDFITLFKGALWFIPSLVVLSFVQNIFKVSYRPVEHYLYYFYRDHFLYTLFAVVGYLVFFEVNVTLRKRHSFLTILTFLCGFFIMISVNQFFTYIGDFDLYNLILMPIARIATIIALSLIIERFTDEVSGMKIFYGFTMILAPIACGFISFTYMVNMDILALIVAIGLLAGSCGLYYLWKEY
jgi:hypothetical protein